MPTTKISGIRGMGFMWGLKVCENDADIMKWVSLQKQFDLTKSNDRF